jgi:cytochrome bd-type quinol oxidase subunit 2
VTRSLPRRWFLAATAAAGVVVAHGAAYLFAYPNGGERAQHLRVTGHGYWSVAVLLAIAAGACALGAAARRGMRGTAAAISPVALITAQLVLFTGAEMIERAAVGVSPAVLLRSPEFAIGLALQVVVALAARVLLRGAAEAGARLARPPAPSRRRPAPTCSSAVALRAPVRWADAPTRAPPALRLA